MTQTALSETLPDLALVLATGKGLVGIEDSVTGRDKGRVARLESHAVEPELHGKVLAVGRDALGVEGREVSVVLSVLVDEVPEDFVEHGCPDVANLVDGGGAVVVRVDLGVDSHTGGVEGAADTLGLARDPFADGVVGVTSVLGLEADGGGVGVTPAFAHTAGFEQTEAGGVGWATGQTVGEAVRVLVDNNAGIEGAVARGCGGGEHVHAHAWGLAIWWCSKVCVVGAASVLSVEVDKVGPKAASAVVVGLEVTSLLVEA